MHKFVRLGLAIPVLAAGLAAASTPPAQAQWHGGYGRGGYGYHGGYGWHGDYDRGWHHGPGIAGALIGGLAAGAVIGALGSGYAAPPPVVYAQPPVVYAAPPPVYYAPPPPVVYGPPPPGAYYQGYAPGYGY